MKKYFMAYEINNGNSTIKGFLTFSVSDCPIKSLEEAIEHLSKQESVDSSKVIITAYNEI